MHKAQLLPYIHKQVIKLTSCYFFKITYCMEDRILMLSSNNAVPLCSEALRNSNCNDEIVAVANSETVKKRNIV